MISYEMGRIDQSVLLSVIQDDDTCANSVEVLLIFL